MNKLAGALVVFVGMCLLILGSIFLVAWSIENVIVGSMMILIGAGLLYYVYRVEKIEAAKPKLVSQNFNVTMSGSGEMTSKNLTCRLCGGPIAEKDFKVVDGGLMAKCPYCGVVLAVQEAPKW